MADLGRHRSGLAPAGHATVDQLRVAGEGHVGPQAQTFHHARPEAFEQHIGLRDQIQRGGDAVGILHVERDRAPVALEHVCPLLATADAEVLGGSRTIDADHVRAHVGEHHAAERRGADRFEFQDLESAQYAHVDVSCVVVWCSGISGS